MHCCCIAAELQCAGSAYTYCVFVAGAVQMGSVYMEECMCMYVSLFDESVNVYVVIVVHMHVCVECICLGRGNNIYSYQLKFF